MVRGVLVVLLLNFFNMAYCINVSVKSATPQKCERVTQKSFASLFHNGREPHEGG